MKDEIIEVPKWFLENVENTLRIQNNINLDKNTGETCQDRNVKESLNGLRKLLNGEDLTGLERLERLHPELLKKQPQELDEAAEEFLPESHGYFPCGMSLNASEEEGWSRKQMLAMFKAGAKWMAEQGVTTEQTVGRTPLNGPNGVTVFLYDFDGFQPGDKVVVQIRKKEK